MEIQISHAILFTFLCFLLVILKSKKSRRNLPPGPRKLPLIGNMHQLVGPLPHVTLRNLANKYGPLMHLQLGEVSNIVISSEEIAKQIYTTHDLIFCDRPRLHSGDIISYNNLGMGFSSYGKEWREARKVANSELLSATKVQTLRLIREAEVSAAVKDISENEGSIINVGEKLSALTNSIVSRATFGKMYKDQEAFLSNLKELVSVLSGFDIVDYFPSVKILPVITGMKTKVERVHKENNRIIENIIKDYKEDKEKNNKGEKTFLDNLFKIMQENDQKDPRALDKIKAIIMDLFVAGTDTSSTAAEWAMAEMMRNPKIMEKAQAEVRKVYGAKGYVDESELDQLTYLNLVIKETLRLHPPAAVLFPRVSNESCVINGYEIPAKTKVLVNFWAIGRDPKIWTEPETFKPERFIDNPIDFKGSHFELIPFGGGRRICIGLPFAVANMELQLASLLYHFDWKLPNGLKHDEMDMSEIYSPVLKIKTPLSLIPIRYHP